MAVRVEHFAIIQQAIGLFRSGGLFLRLAMDAREEAG